jgi:diadenosine tetraphosphatase ApaH/serine/threonine PP2A family protein phosphatase
MGIAVDIPTLPPGQRLYAIGDIHGRSDLLAELLAEIEADALRREGVERRTLVFIGDYIDRGPDSFGVVELLLDALPAGFDAHFLKGNHESIMLDFLQDATCLDQWLANGAEATLRSYGVDVGTLSRERARPEIWREVFVASLPARHRAFFETLELMVAIGDYLFVHAGVRPGVPLETQDPQDLIWIRGEFLRAADDFGKVVVHGHTPTMIPDVRANRIGIDTGAVFTGRLTALRLEDGSRGFVQTEV